MKDFPIPVRSIGPGSQVEDETLDYMPMPQGMETFRAPPLPEPEQMAGRQRARAALREALVELEAVCQGGGNRHVDLAGLDADDLALVNQVLGEGEVSAVVHAAGGGQRAVQVQEAVFAGVWRVVTTLDGCVVSDIIELGHIPAVLRDAARQDVEPEVPLWRGELPTNVQNAPALLA